MTMELARMMFKLILGSLEKGWERQLVITRIVTAVTKLWS
jgi:hypothetical protein